MMLHVSLWLLAAAALAQDEEQGGCPDRNGDLCYGCLGRSKLCNTHHMDHCILMAKFGAKWCGGENGESEPRESFLNCIDTEGNRCDGCLVRLGKCSGYGEETCNKFEHAKWCADFVPAPAPEPVEVDDKDLTEPFKTANDWAAWCLEHASGDKGSCKECQGKLNKKDKCLVKTAKLPKCKKFKNPAMCASFNGCKYKKKCKGTVKFE